MKATNRPTSRRDATDFLRASLCGAELDHFNVFSAILQVNFVLDGASFWVTMSGRVRVTQADATGGQSNGESFCGILSALHLLIGEHISDVVVDDLGTLLLTVADRTICVEHESDGLEEAWVVTPRTPERYAEHDWSVILDDQRDVFLIQTSKS